MKQLFVLVLAFATHLTFASSNPFLSASVDRSIAINLAQWNGKELTLKIKNLKGNLVHSELIHNTRANAVYNLSKLESGDYVMIIEDATVISSQIIHLGTGINTDPYASQIFKPSVQVKGNFVYVNTLLLGKSAKVAIYDNDGSELHLEQSNEAVTYGKIFDISKLGSGNLVITTSGESFSYPIKKS